MRVTEVFPGIVEKRLTDRSRGEPEAVLALRREAFLLRALAGRGAPEFVDTGDDERGPYLRMEKIPAPTLAERIETQRTPLDPAWLDRAIRASFAALAEVHDATDDDGPLSIVHGDLAPANVAVDDAGARAVLLDFELAHFRGASNHDGAFRGTLAYAAPEVAGGSTPTPASDLFALAATFLHVLTGTPPRTGASFAAALLDAAERPLSRERLDALLGRGPALAQLHACLAHDPSRRPASARAVVLALR